MFAESFVQDLVSEYSEKNDHNKAQEYFKRYEQSFLDEIKEYMNSTITLRDGREVLAKDDLAYKIRKGVAMRAEHIQAPFFTYYMTNFGDKKSKSLGGKKEFKTGETYRDAAIRLGYHELCQPLAEPPTITEKNEAGEEITRQEDPAPKHWVYEWTDIRYKLAELFGSNFTIVKKFRPTDNSTEGFGENKNIRTWECTLFLEFHPKGITDADWLAKMPSEWKTVPKVIKTNAAKAVKATKSSKKA